MNKKNMGAYFKDKKSVGNKRRSLRNFLISAAVATTLVAGMGTFAATRLGLGEHLPLKMTDEIVRDSREFEADLSYMAMDNGKNVFLRLETPIDSKTGKGIPIKVKVSDTFNEQSYKAIEYSFGYMNDIFDSINDRYHFEVIKTSDLSDENGITTITVKPDEGIRNTSEVKQTVGQTISQMSKKANFFRKYDKDQGLLEIVAVSIQKVDISLSETYLNEVSKDEKIHVILHEIFHGLGFLHDSQNYASLMHPTTSPACSGIIGPGDLRVLAAMYCENLTQEEVAGIKNLLNDYEKEYGSYLCGQFKGVWQGESDISKSTLAGKSFDFCGDGKTNSSLVFREDGKYTMIEKNQKNEIIHQYSSSYVLDNGIVAMNNFEFSGKKCTTLMGIKQGQFMLCALADQPNYQYIESNFEESVPIGRSVELER